MRAALSVCVCLGLAGLAAHAARPDPSPPPSLPSRHAVQGYALIEFGKRSEAEKAIKEMDGETLYDKEVRVDWAFVNRESVPHSSRLSFMGCW